MPCLRPPIAVLCLWSDLVQCVELLCWASAAVLRRAISSVQQRLEKLNTCLLNHFTSQQTLTWASCSLFALFKLAPAFNLTAVHSLCSVPCHGRPQCLTCKGLMPPSSCSQLGWKVLQKTPVRCFHGVLCYIWAPGVTGVTASSWLIASHTVLSPINSCVQSFKVSINVHSLRLALICLHQQQFL